MQAVNEHRVDAAPHGLHDGLACATRACTRALQMPPAASSSSLFCALNSFTSR
jgi:hypothetical protein